MYQKLCFMVGQVWRNNNNNNKKLWSIVGLVRVGHLNRFLFSLKLFLMSLFNGFKNIIDSRKKKLFEKPLAFQLQIILHSSNEATMRNVFFPAAFFCEYPVEVCLMSKAFSLDIWKYEEEKNTTQTQRECINVCASNQL